MAPQVFYRKWRPQTLGEVVGQEPITQTLLNALSNDRISHAYLFCGPRGTGKTSTARCLAKAVNCQTNGSGEPCNNCAMCQAITEARALDVIEIDAASNTGVDDIRNLRERVNYIPNEARYKVYIIDEVHMLSNSASNALLKTLEEPPHHVIFILATTEVHKILPTIMSRCQRFDFHRLSQADIVTKLASICETEGIQIDLVAMQLIAKSATGSARDAENLLEQLTTYYGSDIGLHQVQATLGITDDFRIRKLLKHIINNDIAAGMTTINSINRDGLDLKQFNRELVEYLRSLLLIKAGSGDAVDLSPEHIDEMKGLADQASLEQILRATKYFGQLGIGFDNYSTLPLELALVDCILSTEDLLGGTVTPTEQKTEPTRKAKAPPPIVQPEIVSVSQQETPTEEPPAAAEATPSPTPTTTNLSEANGDIERLKINWKQVIDQAPQDTRKTPAIAILRSAGVRPVAIDNGIVTLAFRYSYHKEQVEKNENQQVVTKILSSFLGYPCHIRCILEENHLVKEALKMGAQIANVEEK